MKEIKAFFKSVLSEFKDDRVMLLSAAVAFYSALSLAPLLILAIWVAGSFGESMEQRITAELSTLLGEQSGQLVKTVMDKADERPNTGNLSGIISLVILVFSASGVFAQLQTALNIVWDVRAKPQAGWWNFLRKRFLSLGMILTIGLLLLVSTLFSGFLHAMLGDGNAESSWFWAVVNFVISTGVTLFLFAAIFRFLPDVEIAWRQVWLGATVTAVLFGVGRIAMSQYLANKATDSVFGAAGSLLATLLWVYYSSVILFIGAEMTQVWARRQGTPLQPSAHAVALSES